MWNNKKKARKLNVVGTAEQEIAKTVKQLVCQLDAAGYAVTKENDDGGLFGGLLFWLSKGKDGELISLSIESMGANPWKIDVANRTVRVDSTLIKSF